MSRRLKVKKEILDEFERLVRSDVPIAKAAESLGLTRGWGEKYVKRNKIPHCNKTGPRGGPRHQEWKGGRVNARGYIMVWCPDHPTCVRKSLRRKTKAKYMMEHRLVMEAAIGRLLEDKEVVHHKNGDRADNRIENLELFSSNGAHLAKELKGRRPNWSPEGYARMCAPRCGAHLYKRKTPDLTE